MKWLLGCLLIAGVGGPAAQTPSTPAQPPKGQMPDLGRNTQQDDKVPLFDYDMYFLGKWTFEWDMPEGPLGPPGRTEGTTTYTGSDGKYEAVTEATGPNGPFTVRERIQYDKAQRTILRDVVDSRGFKYTQAGTIGGDLGGLYTIYFESQPFLVNGQRVRLKHVMRLTAPLAHRVSITVAEGDGPYRNYGTPWWRKGPPGQ
jgi:hypothetical protein